MVVTARVGHGSIVERLQRPDGYTKPHDTQLIMARSCRAGPCELRASMRGVVPRASGDHIPGSGADLERARTTTGEIHPWLTSQVGQCPC